MLVLSDTHGTDDPALTDHLREQIADADLVVHAGDFTTPAVLEGFESLADRLVAVHGNADSAVVRERLPAMETVQTLGVTVLVVHGHDHDETQLSLLARQEGADVVVLGHTHRPGVGQIGEVAVLNPGSHADPRGAQPAYAAVGQASGDVVARLRTPAGALLEQRSLSEGRAGRRD
ncbi:metallophosphoesterase [Salinibaculum rarum]|uniref:metallophosphoesterase n=1 Tax=Salinibaculum rarum TaxID=3058903 RepID=UPI00265FC994|nr:metallophosphoesterase [Salinibaculum sp. KK48]